MGFFSGLKTSEPSFNVQRAIMTIIIAAIKADGEVSDDEVIRLRSMCARSPIFASNSKEEDDAVIGWADNVTTQLKADAIRKAAAALKSPLRETAFAFACEMVLADGMVGDAEEKFISMLGETLGISQELGSAVVQVTIVRMRGAD
ncbi:MAG TPA: tellurite resistance TerB family protein [Tepidisphaeraceae bacterium]|nr:tellurite resistance TerB family protein [Tepidisphaeraceae bacterium]